MRGGHLEANTITGLISALSLAVDRPIIGHTGLSAVYDMTLDFEFDRSLARIPVRPGGGAGQTVPTRKCCGTVVSGGRQKGLPVLPQGYSRCYSSISVLGSFDGIGVSPGVVASRRKFLE